MAECCDEWWASLDDHMKECGRVKSRRNGNGERARGFRV